MTRLEVWGDPIAHSRSPDLHNAAYEVLGTGWEYGRRRVAEADFPAEIAALGPEYHGLSLTMPLKTAAFDFSTTLDRRAELTGAVNTLRLLDGERSGVNTDVGGIVRALGDEDIARIGSARIVGAGATATSAVVALAELGAERIDVSARRPEAVERLVELGSRMGVVVKAVPFGAADLSPVDVTIATLPGNAPVAPATADALAGPGGLLLDVVYGQWPTPLATAWLRASGRAVPGLGMLLHQALLQIRFFLAGDTDIPLPDEAAVLAAMRHALA